VLRAIPETPGTCRLITRAALQLRHLASLADDAGTIVTELAANAVTAMLAEARAGRLDRDIPVIMMTLAWISNGVRIEVWDRSPDEPQINSPDWESESGRGLFLVDQLTAGRWGYRRKGQSKCVWAEVTL
jgi:serine/threonine-protein kinase RsbW